MPDTAYAPFERHDRYGKMGLAPQSAWSRLKTCLAAVTILPVKAIGTISCVASFFVVCKLMQLLPEQQRSAAVAAAGKAFCRACLLCIGFTRVRWLSVTDPANSNSAAARPHAAGIVSNHCSWADILVHMSHSFPSFVARSGTESLPLIGFIRWGCTGSVMPMVVRSQSTRAKYALTASRWAASMWSVRARQRVRRCGAA